MPAKYKWEDIRAADPIAKRLAQLPKEDNIKVFGPRIIELMQGVPWDVFTVLDEQPGRWGYMGDRFYMLRRVRNDKKFGKQLFEGLKR